MNNSLLKKVGAAILVAVVGFILLSQFLTAVFNPPIAFAAGAIVAGILIALLDGGSASAASSGETTTLYVGNLPYRANEAAVKELFSEYGEVQSVRLLKDRQTGKRRGFGFVEMFESDAAKAIKSLNDNEFMQRTIKVREAKNQPKDGNGETVTD